MNNIQRVIVFLLISGVSYVVLSKIGSGSYALGMREEPLYIWLVITAITGFFLFRTKD